MRSARFNVIMAGETILLVEGDHIVRSLLARLLRIEGYSVIQAANGVEALEKWKQHHGVVHLVLTDIQMPVSNGSELIQILTGSHSETKVLYVTAVSAEALSEIHPGTTSATRLEKPVSRDALLKKVRELLQK